MATAVPLRISPTPFFPLPMQKPLFSSTPRFLSPSKTPFHIHKTFFLFLSFSSRNGKSNTPPTPETECPVPQDQQPINEYQSLSTSFPFSWASDDVVEYSSRLFVTGATFALFVGLPVAWFGSVGAESEPLKRILCATSSGVFAVTLAVVRMYLGWAYVGNRLLSATVEYEETGWYDGQIWVKTAEVLARDRLLGSFSDKDSGKMIGHDREQDGLYYLETPRQLNRTKGRLPYSFTSEFLSTNKDRIWLVQRRLGHPSFMIVKSLLPSLFKSLDVENF